MNLAETAIARINAEECFRLRKVDGRDINDWHTTLAKMRASGDTAGALGLLYKIIAACETLEQYDPREPQPYWYEQAAKLHEKRGELTEAEELVVRWLSFWRGRERGEKTKMRALLDKLVVQHDAQGIAGRP